MFVSCADKTFFLMFLNNDSYKLGIFYCCDRFTCTNISYTGVIVFYLLVIDQNRMMWFFCYVFFRYSIILKQLLTYNSEKSSLANSTSSFLFSGLHVYPHTNLIPLLRSTIRVRVSSYWNANWVNLPRSYASEWRIPFPYNFLKPSHGFGIYTLVGTLLLNIIIIIIILRLRLCHNCLPVHAFKLGINDRSSGMFPDCGDNRYDT